jgi:hypothetical protein
MEGEKFFEHSFTKYPGLDLVVQIVTLLFIPLALSKETIERWSLALLIIVLAGAILLFRLSSRLDDVVFDPLYGTARKRLRRYEPLCRVLSSLLFPVVFLIRFFGMKRRLAHERGRALRTLKYPLLTSTEPLPPDETFSGLYSAAKTIFSSGEEWENKVRARLEYSKAARVFVVPLLLLTIWTIVQPWPRFAPLIGVDREGLTATLILASDRWWVMYVAMQALAGTYLWLRIVHMVKLYGMVAESRCFRFEVRDEIGNVRTLLSVGSSVVPLSQLAIFRKSVLCVGLDPETFHTFQKNEFLDVTSAKDVDEMKRSVSRNDFDFVIVSDGVESAPPHVGQSGFATIGGAVYLTFGQKPVEELFVFINKR